MSYPPFGPATQAWFDGAFAAPTAAQLGAWAAIGRGDHTLVVAPTGSGKTLAAFLSAIDRLAQAGPPADPARRCRVLYVSPMKALAVDVERNLRSPLAGIGQAAARLGLPAPDLRVATRSGDTPAADRRMFTRQPPDILITTPESLFLLLTSAAREALRGVDTVIVDEIHAVVGSKRGSHLALSLERLDRLLEPDGSGRPRSAQRIGLSATVRPVEEVSTFLAGGRPVSIVEPHSTKQWDLAVVVPVEDLSQLGEPTADHSGAAASGERRASIWPHVEQRVLDLIRAHRSTIVFANSRRLAERLTARLNELAAELAHGELAGGELAGGELAGGELGDVSGAPAGPMGLPAQLMAQAGSGLGLPSSAPVVARAHHGSVSREQRSLVEEELKAGRLPAVVATSSLELGIDMGAVDLVVQVESPPSVAAGLQRVGRAGHQVGAVSRGVIFPKYRGDLVQCTVVAERMRAGQIEQLRYPRNPLDVLAQQVVAMVAMDVFTVDQVETMVRRAAPFAALPRSALEATLDMIAGRYPSDAFAGLRPRVVWDRVTDELSARAGAQRLAVTAGGTIPDRGTFAVFLAAGDGPGRRVGELDEEMVYESRVGDTFLLGSSSWRIEDITHDRVLVSPAPGQVGKMPFWRGDSAGRPAELGRAVGAFVRELVNAEPAAAAARAAGAGLDEWGVANLLDYLREQRQATGQVPDDRTIVVERFRDELGDWRLVVHCPLGAPVTGPWALAIAARIREQLGIVVQAMHSDDGIVVRLPDTDGEPPDANLVVFDPAELEPMITAELGGSALFASRFRECAARSLLLPKSDPRRRAPLWQQRQKANQLLQVISDYPRFPVALEAMRECLQDVFDIGALVELMAQLQARVVRLVDVQTPTPSPFARSLLFGYVGMFLYEGDAPLAERRAQALSLDSALLAELLGTTDLRELLDQSSLEQVSDELQRLPVNRQARGADAIHDLLRGLGDLTTEEACGRGATAQELAELMAQRRAIRVHIAGQQRWLAIEDAARVRDALGTPLPVGIPEAFLEPVHDPIGDLISRFARTHGPFSVAEAAARFGLGGAVVTATLNRLQAAGRVIEGQFSPSCAGTQWCDTEVLRALRRRSLAALRKEVEPVPQRALARFLPAWQGISSQSRGVEGLLRAVEQLAGALVPASALETLVLPARVRDYSPALLDELTAAGEVVWAGAGALGGSDGWICLSPADVADLLLPAPVHLDLSPEQAAVVALLDGDQALFARTLAGRTGLSERALQAAIWELVWAGRVTNDTLAPLRAVLAGPGRSSHSSVRRPPRLRYGRTGGPVIPVSRAGLGATTADGAPPAPSGNSIVRGSSPMLAGRWSQLSAGGGDPTRRAVALANALLDRYGVVVRGEVMTEQATGGFAAVYPVLAAAADTGRARRGYFVEGLGGSQFASVGAVDRLRAMADSQATGAAGATTLVLAATDPANPYGAALPWPATAMAASSGIPELPGITHSSGILESRTAGSDGVPPLGAAARRRGHQPARKAGALVVMTDGDCVLYVERGGRTLLSFTEDAEQLQAAADALALSVREGLLGKLQIERADGEPVSDSPLASALLAAGFRPTPRGLRLRAAIG